MRYAVKLANFNSLIANSRSLGTCFLSGSDVWHIRVSLAKINVHLKNTNMKFSCWYAYIRHIIHNISPLRKCGARHILHCSDPDLKIQWTLENILYRQNYQNRFLTASQFVNNENQDLFIQKCPPQKRLKTRIILNP